MKIISLSLSLLVLTPLLARSTPAEQSSAIVSAPIPGVGTATDPARDCRIAGDAARLTIAIPEGDHALDIEENRMTAPRVLREVSGDFSAEVTVSGTYPHGASTEVPNHRAFQGAGLLLWVDSDTYVRLERAQINLKVEGEVRHAVYLSWELRLEGKSLRMGGVAGLALKADSTRLRISRTGNKVGGAVSEDGVVWRELDPLTLKLPEKVQIGVVAGHNTTGTFEAVFEKFILTPNGAPESKKD